MRRGSSAWEGRWRTRSWPRSSCSSKKPTRGSSTSSPPADKRRRDTPSSSHGHGRDFHNVSARYARGARAFAPPPREAQSSGEPELPSPAGSLWVGHVDHSLESTQREAGYADGGPTSARDRKRRKNTWHDVGFASARSKRAQRRR